LAAGLPRPSPSGLRRLCLLAGTSLRPQQSLVLDLPPVVGCFGWWSRGRGAEYRGDARLLYPCLSGQTWQGGTRGGTRQQSKEARKHLPSETRQALIIRGRAWCEVSWRTLARVHEPGSNPKGFPYGLSWSAPPLFLTSGKKVAHKAGGCLSRRLGCALLACPLSAADAHQLSVGKQQAPDSVSHASTGQWSLPLA